MKEENSVQVFDKGDKLPELPKGLGLRTDFEVASPFGFKIVEIEGKIMWQAGTEEDYCEAESKRLNIPPEKVKGPGFPSCYQTGPFVCSGTCVVGLCKLAYLASQQYYYCVCA